jgi:hypothetical protein
MDLNPLFIDQPVVTSAQDAVVYDCNYLIEMQVAPPDGSGRQAVACVFRPYCSAQGSIYPQGDKDRVLRINDLFGLLQHAPVLAVTFQDLLAKIDSIYQVQLVENNRQRTSPEDAQWSELSQQLAGLKTNLGASADMTLPGVSLT